MWALPRSRADFSLWALVHLDSSNSIVQKPRENCVSHMLAPPKLEHVAWPGNLVLPAGQVCVVQAGGSAGTAQAICSQEVEGIA